MTNHYVLTADAIIDSSIILKANHRWSQEDFSTISEQFFRRYHECVPQLTVSGADRVDVEFFWDAQRFALKFECYSESIWIEPTDTKSEETLVMLYHALCENSDG